MPLSEVSIAGKINQANARLKLAKCGMRIERRGERLVLRGTLPPKPGSSKLKPYQQRVSLNVYANPVAISYAEREARKIGALMACKEFSWEPYLRPVVIDELVTVSEWVEEFERDYFNRRDRNDKTETTWRGDYLKVLNRLPPNAVLTEDILRQAIIGTTPDTKTRARYCFVLQALANLAKLDCDFRRLRGNYSPNRVSPRQLPSDEEIAAWYRRIKNPSWRWIYAMIATYGLRPHEAFALDFEALKDGVRVASILDGKTGARRTWAYYPEWFDEFHLAEVTLPKISLDRTHEAIGASACRYFGRYVKLPFKLYDLRHCWAVRTLEFGLDISLAAQQMGHSVQVHSQQYHAWISERHHQRAYERLAAKSDRPLPPSWI